MATIRPARTCREWQRPWTRTAKYVVTKAFVRGVPDPKIRKYDTGDVKSLNKYDVRIDILAGGNYQIRHNALEAVRVNVSHWLETSCVKSTFYFKIYVYPHQVIREHSILMGAGADRMSQGMKHAFGHPTGRAARVKKGQKIVSIYVFKKFEQAAKAAAKKALARLPGVSHIEIHEMKDGKIVQHGKVVKVEPKKAKKKTVQPVKKIEEKKPVAKKESLNKIAEKAIKEHVVPVHIETRKVESINKLAEKAIKEPIMPVHVETRKVESVNKLAERVLKEPVPVPKPVYIEQKRESISKMAERVLNEVKTEKKTVTKKPDMIIA